MRSEIGIKKEYRISSLEGCDELIDSSLPYEKKIEVFATFLRNAGPDASTDLLNRAMEYLVHLQFKHRKDRNYGMIVTEDEYWAIRNVVWNIDKQIFWIVCKSSLF